jgi:formate hydrogenlyase subunit 4
MMFMPCFGNGWLHVLAMFAGITLLSVATGVIESVMARMRFLKSPQTLMGAVLVAALAVLVFVCF